MAMFISSDVNGSGELPGEERRPCDYPDLFHGVGARRRPPGCFSTPTDGQTRGSHSGSLPLELCGRKESPEVHFGAF